MSTEIKNTLFRMVTQRAPEMSDEKNKEIRFVIRDQKTMSGKFDIAVNAKAATVTKWQAMLTEATSFIPLKEEELKTLDQDHYEFSIWLARNRTTCSKAELDAKVVALVGITARVTTVDLKNLWDNLFYQVLTQKDFYIKETIIHLLVGYNFLQNYDTIKDEQNNLLAAATVVLPEALFVETAATVVDTAGKTVKEGEDKEVAEVSYQSELMRQQQAITLAKIRNESNKQLKKELTTLEKAHRKEYQTEYKKAQDAHEKLVKPILATYNTAVETSKKEWCTTNAATFDPNNPCHQLPVVPYPDLPKFEFTYSNEISLKLFQSKLSPASYARLMEIMGREIVVEVPIVEELASAKVEDSFDDGDDTGGYDGYGDIYTDIDDDTTTNNDVVITNTTTTGNSSVSIGGVVIPVTTGSNLAPFQYQICPTPIGNGRFVFNMSLQVMDASWIVADSASYHTYTVSSNNSTNGIFVADRIGDTISLNLQSSHLISDESQVMEISGQIAFTNGYKKDFIINGINAHQCYIGNTWDHSNPNTGGGNSTTPPKEISAFIPSGFGVKQLGIADYKKVEQSVQCYVEGEVAHIENIMARERRDRSTRRLVKTENTDIQSLDTETEKVTDTTTTDRFEMHTEIAKIMQESQDKSASAYMNSDAYQIHFGANASFASHSSNEENTRQAITQAKEITNKATDRITTKVYQERIRKVTEEFEETNIHEFDNRKGDKHVVGVYRWVDKLYKNQIVNYGKRLSFEFMVPEPAKLHLMGMKENSALGTVLIKPTDPRKATNQTLASFMAVDDMTAKYWAGVYNVDLKPLGDQYIWLNKTFSGGTALDPVNNRPGIAVKESVDLEISKGYQSIHAKINATSNYDSTYGQYYSSFGFTVGNIAVLNPGPLGSVRYIDIDTEIQSIPPIYKLDKFVNKISVGCHSLNNIGFDISISIKCELTQEAQKQWQQNTFKAIIDAYNIAEEEYKQRLAEEQTKASNIKGTNPGFYRQIENMVLRKNCISYIIDQTTTAKNTYGKDMTKYNYVNGVKQDPTFGSYEIAVKKDLDDYAAFVKFIEQAFEWDIMSYNFYPYYWGARADWAQLYQYDNNDPLFRSFMQSGMARVIVTVRPGFEEAVRFYMQTGQIWNGGAVPVIEDKLFMSIVDELRAPAGKKEGKAWITRVPTALTILQANSIGLEVEKALPCHCEDIAEFEDPSQIPCADSFVLNNAQINGGTGTAKLFGKITGIGTETSRITLKTAEGLLQDSTNTDENGEWELKNIPAGTFALQLDANNLFTALDYEILEGTKLQTLALTVEQVVEINLTVNKL